MLLLFYCIFLIQSKAVAQNLKKRDSLENYIKTAPADISKANALVLLSNEIVQYNTKKSSLYALEAISISKKIKYPKTEAEALLVLSKIDRAQKNCLLAIKKTVPAIRIFEKLNDKTGLAKAYFELGYIYKDIGNYEKAVHSFTEALRLYNETGDKSKVASCQMVIGHVNADNAFQVKDTAYYHKALVLYSTSLNYYKSVHDQEKISVSLLNLGNLYLSYNSLSPSDKFLEKSLYYSNASLKTSQEQKDQLRTSINLSNIAEAYNAQKKYHLALDYYNQAYKILKEINNIDYTLLTLHSIILTYKDIKEYDKALVFSKEYLKIAQKNNYVGAIKNYYELQSEIYLAKNNFEEAYKNRLLYEKYLNMILNEEKEKALIKSQLEFESDNKDREIILLSKNQELQEAKLKQQQTTRNYLIAGIVLVLLLLILIYSRFILKNRANKIIEEKNKQLEKLSIVARETANGVFITDANGDIEWFNEGFSKLFGWKSIEKYKKKRGENIFTVSGNENIANLIKESIEEKKSVTYENATPTKNKDQLWIQTTLTPIFNDQGVLDKLVFVETDITRLKNSEAKYLEVNKELEAFSYSISHDLRSPLRAINGYSKILQEEYAEHIDSEGINVLNAILNNSKKMGELIDDLLTFSRLGRTALITSEINMTTLVQSVIQEEMIGNLSEIEFNINELPTSKGTQTLIKQVWINLISNAIKFSEHQSKPRIDIGSYTEEDTVVYYVKDNGAGFDIKYYNKLFGVFQRLHSQEEFEGTGIGLAIVQKIIQRHNGTVWAESEVNKGSCFYFSLPSMN
ncbi:MAG: ATP-binding protein [Flavobacterium sp.]